MTLLWMWIIMVFNVYFLRHNVCLVNHCYTVLDLKSIISKYNLTIQTLVDQKKLITFNAKKYTSVIVQLQSVWTLDFHQILLCWGRALFICCPNLIWRPEALRTYMRTKIFFDAPMRRTTCTLRLWTAASQWNWGCQWKPKISKFYLLFYYTRVVAFD